MPNTLMNDKPISSAAHRRRIYPSSLQGKGGVGRQEFSVPIAGIPTAKAWQCNVKDCRKG